MSSESVKTCHQCGGEGTIENDELRAIHDWEEHGQDCPVCEDSGRVTCPECDGEDEECLECDFDGLVRCDQCDGNGTVPDNCSTCGEALERVAFGSIVGYLGDGEILCNSCGSFGDLECPDCKGEGVVAHEGVQDPRGQKGFCRTVKASCSCCGAAPRPATKNEDGWHVYRANVVDVDGVYFPFLCGDEAGHCGCLEEAERAGENEREGEKLVAELMPDDPDGVISTIEDFRYIGLL